MPVKSSGRVVSTRASYADLYFAKVSLAPVCRLDGPAEWAQRLEGDRISDCSEIQGRMTAKLKLSGSGDGEKLIRIRNAEHVGFENQRGGRQRVWLGLAVGSAAGAVGAAGSAEAAAGSGSGVGNGCY